MATDKTPLCPFCQAPLTRADARFCSSCGRALSPSPTHNPTTILAAGGAFLQISESGNERHVLLGSRPLTIGRAADNDIVLQSRFVSGRHARIEPSGQGHRIVDVGSRNGLLFAGQRVSERELADGDILRIGDPATGNFVSLMYHNPMLTTTAAEQAVPQQFPLDPNDPEITIGRVGCDIILNNPQVSRFHAQIDRTPGGVVLRDMGSTNGTFVNGQRVTAPVMLKPGDVIQIGAFKLVYNVTRLDRYDQQGALRIDARNLSRVVMRNGVRRIILNDVSLSIAPREFVAIVGGSGTGKSTLMKALCGYAPADQGHVLVNGDDFYRNFAAYRTVLGYVPQDDILHRQLPVQRALEYSARLRLPADTSDQEVATRIERVLDDVEMTPHRDKPIEALSGGQRKRVSIGAELLADPSLFFLDEPTSGLDPGLEKKMMYTLRRLADSGRTVVLVTHATANITQCDHVIFMAGNGRMVFFGPPAEALRFFQITSGDFADIYTKIEGIAAPDHPVVRRDLKAEYDMWCAAHPQADGPPTLAELWEMRYRQSSLYQRYVVERLASAPSGPQVQNPTVKQAPQRVSAWRQFGLLTRRYFDLMRQDRRNVLILLLQAPIIALLLVLVVRSDALTGTQAQDLIQRSEAKKVLFMLATVSVWFGIINAAREITKEQAIYRRERLVNLRIGPYLFSKVTILSGLIVVQTIVLLAIVLLKVGFPGDTGILLPPLIETFITLVLSSGAGMALGLAISAASATPDRAISLVPFALIPQILFAGLIFAIEGLATPLSWLTISRWAMDALGASLDINRLCNLPNTDDQGSIPPGCSPGFLEIEAAFSHDPAHLIGRWLALGTDAVVCLLIAAWILRRRDRMV
ncbi:FHA domain-containing protein [Chloroflexus aggregans]|uniref:FHA modulated ABC efflux pump with fused ATPase and integral membrane subunits n=1 Tax=Chloroflexus aggregans (strain MD-66 / DSM 9485) TaxID=326427 RepID=B8G542_CHLAD|nr:FHA domain-containing protein [Chloroflexus aggregans]ACL23675.1 FHA modulated ABC efflux pump with fused ATPase and integral membrane subunits [Chloroflexus aggregans DSM 9485]